MGDRRTYAPGQGCSPSRPCEECETARQRHNALVANGLISQARAAGRTYDALQAAHQSSRRRRYVENEEGRDD